MGQRIAFSPSAEQPTGIAEGKRPPSSLMSTGSLPPPEIAMSFTSPGVAVTDRVPLVREGDQARTVEGVTTEAKNRHAKARAVTSSRLGLPTSFTCARIDAPWLF